MADVNDNRPRFGDDHVTVHVMETAQPGTQFVLPSADDADSGDNGVKEYQLRHDGNATAPFELVVTDQVSTCFSRRRHAQSTIALYTELDGQ